ncbi:OmpA family protein [Spirosoma fluminis]
MLTLPQVNGPFLFRYGGRLLLAAVVYALSVGQGMAQNKEVDYSRTRAPLSTANPVLVKSAPVDSGRKAAPSVLTIKAFAVDIRKPLASARVRITSGNTKKQESFVLLNGQLECLYTAPDVLTIEVGGEGYTTVKRTMTIAMSPTGNRYEFDAQLDPAGIKLIVWAVDSRTRKIINDAHFTISGKAGSATLLLTPDSTTGKVKTELPGKGVYQLASSAAGYGSFIKPIRLDSAENEAQVLLSPVKSPTTATEAQALPEAVVKSVKTPTVETPAPAPAVRRPVLSGTIKVPVITNKQFGVVEKAKPVQLKNLYFDQSSPVIRPESVPELDQLAAMLQENPSLQLEIRGHTDNQGDFDLNVTLSRDRCQSVINYLVSKGIARGRLKAVGRGPIDALVPNTSEANRKQNRRVEFVVL